MKTIVGLFDNFSEAQQVVQDFVNAGFDRNQISLVANNAGNQYDPATFGRQEGGGEGVVRDTDGSGGSTAESAGTGAKAGAYVGGALGLLAGLGALAIPGVGPVIAAGPIATALGSTALGAGLGAAAGGLLGGLVGLGVPEEEAGYYTEGVRRGGALLSASVPDDRVDEAVAMMNRHGAVNIDQRRDYYRQSGYKGFSADAAPYSAEELQTYRQSNPNIYGAAAATRAAAPAMAATTTAANATGMNAGTTTVEAGDRVAVPIV